MKTLAEYVSDARRGLLADGPGVHREPNLARWVGERLASGYVDLQNGKPVGADEPEEQASDEEAVSDELDPEANSPAEQEAWAQLDDRTRRAALAGDEDALTEWGTLAATIEAEAEEGE